MQQSLIFKFNGKKSKLLIFKGKGCKIGINKIEVNGGTIHSSAMATHLGHRTSVGDNDSMPEFGGIYSFIKCKLFKQYWCSCYGSNLWPLTSKTCYNICVA